MKEQFHSAGELKVDEEAMQRKLAADRLKLWKHRASLVWEELEAPTGIAVGAGITYWIGFIFFHKVEGLVNHPHQLSCYLMSLLPTFVVGMVLLAVGFVSLVVYDAKVQPAIRRIQYGWNRLGRD